MIVNITDYNLDSFLRNESSVLILGRSNCNRCITYQDEVRRFMANGALAGTAVGVLMLDQPGTSQFKRDNLWLMSVDFLPYTLLYRRGRRVDGFSGHRGHLLLDRSRRMSPAGLALATAD